MRKLVLGCCCLMPSTVSGVLAQDTKDTPTYQRMKAYLDSVPAIDTHDHLWPFDRLPGYVETDRGRGMNLAGLWTSNYFTWLQRLTPWTPGGKFEDWWTVAKHDFENYRDRKWLYEVVTERANIELMLNEPHWGRHNFTTDYPWEVLVYKVGPLLQGYHPSEFRKPADDPYYFAESHGLKVESAGPCASRPRLLTGVHCGLRRRQRSVPSRHLVVPDRNSPPRRSRILKTSSCGTWPG